MTPDTIANTLAAIGGDVDCPREPHESNAEYASRILTTIRDMFDAMEEERERLIVLREDLALVRANFNEQFQTENEPA